MPRPITVLFLLMGLAAAPSTARSNGDGITAGPADRVRALRAVRLHPVRPGVVPHRLAAGRPDLAAGFPRAAAASGARPGEIAFEVLRAYQPGRPDWKSLALRVTLSVATGPGGDLFRLGTGLLDGSEVRALAQAVGEMGRVATAAPAEPRADSIDADFHGGTLRVGVLQIRGDAVGGVQTGDLPILLQRAVWDVPTTLYVPLKDLGDVEAVLGRAAARIDQVRDN
jgi:hypothetical protein